MCHEQPSIEKLQRTGVIVGDDNMKVLNMEEKPREPKSHWAVPPFYIYLKKDLEKVRHIICEYEQYAHGSSLVSHFTAKPCSDVEKVVALPCFILKNIKN